MDWANVVSNLGTAAAIVVAFLTWMHRVQTVTLPKLMEDREKDLAWARAEIDKKREEYLRALQNQQAEFQTALREQRTDFVAALDRVNAITDRNERRWQTAVEMITNEVRDLRSEVRAVLHNNTTEVREA